MLQCSFTMFESLLKSFCELFEVEENPNDAELYYMLDLDVAQYGSIVSQRHYEYTQPLIKTKVD